MDSRTGQITLRVHLHGCKGPAAGGAHLALESVGFLGPLSLHVFGQHSIFMQFLPVVKVAGECLGLLSMPEVYHVHGQVKVGLTLFKPFLIFNLECNKTSLKAVLAGVK